MLILISGSTKSVYSKADPRIGVLVVPEAQNVITKIPDNIPIAADNGCFNGFNPVKFIYMLEQLKKRPPLWVCCPDAVGDANQTLELFTRWYSVIAAYGYPISFAFQDGQLLHRVPWDQIGCLFVGGTTEWKLGEQTREAIRYAKRLGKWVHMGRVNGKTRLQYAKDLLCDSVDGSSFSRFTDVALSWALPILDQ